MQSFWQMQTTLPAYPTLHGEIQTDVLVVGGGLAGILCAYQLTRANVPCVLLEADRICAATTAHTTAKITSMHGLCYQKLIARYGVLAAQQYYQANEAALAEYRKLAAQIPCDFSEQNAYVYSLTDTRKLEAEMRALAKLDVPAQLFSEVPLPFPTAGAVCFPKQAQFSPLCFVAGLLPGLQIYEHSAVRQFVKLTALTAHGRVRAKAVIIATHFPILNKHGGYFLKLYQNRSYVIAAANAPDYHGMYLCEDEKGLSLRNANGHLLVGGGAHRTGSRSAAWEMAETFLHRYCPAAKEVCRYAAQDCMTLDHLPYIGAYSPRTPGFYVATGFHKWGMTGAMVAATLLTDQILGRDTPYSALFSPARRMLHPQLFANLGASTLGLLTPWWKRCPHLGCALHWNAAEHSWDCPCHGSRFSETGKWLDGPATGDLPKSE